MALTSTNGVVRSMPVIGLDDPAAADAQLVGMKAANLAKAAGLGLPVLPGAVLTTDACAALEPGWAVDQGVVAQELRGAWARLSDEGRVPVVVRSSSSAEDTDASSMAGVFDSVLDVRTWADVVAAIDAVVASGRNLAGGPVPMAVLIQPQLDPRLGGVLFGADPLTGRLDHVVVAAVDGGPHRLVHGEVNGARYILSSRGRTRSRDGDATPTLARNERRALVDLARTTARVFGAPQDVEWAVDAEGHLWLLQSRPITAIAEKGSRRTPVFGPGPVAETFPEALAPLETDLWVEPLRAGLAEALVLGGLATRRQVRRSPVVVTVGGRVAADLGLLGLLAKKRSFVAFIDPRPRVRKLAAAWRVGRLRVALPGIVDDLLERLERDLAAVPPLADLDDQELVHLLHRTRQALVSLHGYEVVAGMLVPDGAEAATSAGQALRALAAARARGLDDTAAVAASPAVLALVPPRIGRQPVFPPVPAVPRAPVGDVDELATRREALRLRARWVQELSARAASEIAGRLVARGLAGDVDAVRQATVASVDAAITTGAPLCAEPPCGAARSSAPLPAAFRLTGSGTVVPVEQPRGAGGEGVGAAGGRTVGRVVQAVDELDDGSVLVVRTLDPNLAPVLPRLGGLIAETGSVLSHLAILAREYGVPTVVGVPDALRRFPVGTAVALDGTTGDVARLDVEGGDAVVELP